MPPEPLEVAQTYLGNLAEDEDLAAQVAIAQTANQCLTVFLQPTDPGKGRIQTQTTTGVTVGIIKERGWSLRPDDILLTDSGKLLLIQLQAQQVMVLTFTEAIANHAVELVQLGHVLGNHHWPINIHDQKIYVQLVADQAVVEKTIQNLHIPGLQIDYEWRSPQKSVQFAHTAHHHHQHH